MRSRSEPHASWSGRGERVAEHLRLASARCTKEIVLRLGDGLGMYVGCGYPKSGTVWLCQLMSTYLGVPFPRGSYAPVAMSSVIHAHWRYDARLTRAAYIRRDGRDVMLSLYFYQLRKIATPYQSAATRQLREDLHRLYGPRFDPDAVRANLPAFVEWQLRRPYGSGGLTWQQHVADWWERPGVGQLSYERLLAAPVAELSGAMRRMTGDADEAIAELALRRWSFSLAAGRSCGQEDRGSFLRKGVAGDWRAHFSREAGEIFDGGAGDALVELGYADDRTWWTVL